jgi:hypothetical protein
MKWTAIEIFYNNRKNAFFAFNSKEDYEKTFKKIVALAPSNVLTFFGTPEKLFKK